MTEKLAPTLQTSCNDYSRADGFTMMVYENHPSDSRVKPMGDVCQTVTSSWGTGGGNIPFVQFVDTYNGTIQGNVSATMTADMAGPTHSGPKVMVQSPIPEYYAHQYCQDRVYSTEGITPALNCSQAHKFRFDMAVRRLTPVECERLQGFPDNYTNIKENCPDGPRYKALGNSMAVPVMRWIGERINQYEQRGVEKHL
jgi:site-specific DNA-cytosine methylase